MVRILQFPPSLDFDEENVMPGPNPARSTIDTRNVEPVVLEHEERVRQGALRLVRDAERDERFPFRRLRAAGLDEKFWRQQALIGEVDVALLDDEESGRVVFDVLDAGRHDREAVDVGR